MNGRKKAQKGIARRSRAPKRGRKSNRRGAENAEVRREEDPSEAAVEVLVVAGDFGRAAGLSISSAPLR